MSDLNPLEIRVLSEITSGLRLKTSDAPHAIGSLEARGLIQRDPRRGYVLTPAGQETANALFYLPPRPMSTK